MVRGLYSATAGALVAQLTTDTLANNLANVNTGGFKRTLLQVESTDTMPIYRLQTDPGRTPGTSVPGVSVADPIGLLGSGSRVYDTPANFEQGALRPTDAPLDMAISGSGFFTIQTAQGVRYTRDGSFVRNNQGLLATQSGDLVLGQNNGSIAIPEGNLTVDRNGAILVADPNAPTAPPRTVGTLQITEFANLVGLRPEGANRFVDSGVANPQNATQSSVVQGAIEGSNADVIRSMVGLIVAQRWFEANEKMIQTQDTMNQQAINDVGRNH